MNITAADEMPTGFALSRAAESCNTFFDKLAAQAPTTKENNAQTVLSQRECRGVLRDRQHFANFM